MRYAASNLSDRIGADSCPCAFHWLQYLLGQPRLSENFSRGASRGPLRARRRAELQASFSRPHRVRDCHHDHRCGALAAGFSEHQPVAVAHAMGLSTGRVLPSVAPALASVPKPATFVKSTLRLEGRECVGHTHRSPRFTCDRNLVSRRACVDGETRPPGETPDLAAAPTAAPAPRLPPAPAGANIAARA